MMTPEQITTAYYALIGFTLAFLLIAAFSIVVIVREFISSRSSNRKPKQKRGHNER